MPERAPNILSVDVEDWFHILESDAAPEREQWGDLESRVERNTDRLLALFEEYEARATFFVVGWVAARVPAMVRRIADAGHELGSHSYWHEVIGRHTPDSLAADLEHSKALLEDLSGTSVRGFRAPGGSITPHSAWAFDLLCEAGFEYDSSLCPGISSHGGFASEFFGPHRVRCEAGELVEIPSSTRAFGPRRIPYAGGGYFRLFPYSLIRSSIARDNERGEPANVYLHPREIDPEQPRMELPPVRRFKYYVGLAGAEAKLRSLLGDHSFGSAWDWIEGNVARLDERVLDVRADATAHPPLSELAQAPPPAHEDVV